jgi:hypothetical protein
MQRLPVRVALAIALACALGGVAFTLYGIGARPYGAVESELVFQASRIQHHLPLYVDPYVGAWDSGPPPSRYYVLYTPLWPWLLAHASPAGLSATRTTGRVIDFALMLVALAALVGGAQRRNREAVLCGALLALGLHMLVREAGLATADVPAVALTALGLVRMHRRGRLDALSAALLVTAPLVKPSVLGVLPGAFGAHLVMHRRSGWRSGWKERLEPLVAAAAAGGALAAVYHVTSGGVWL